MTVPKNRIMIFGPKEDGTYVVESRTAEGEALAISVPRSEACLWSENSMRLFVTGATGVIGWRAVPLLLSQGHPVTAGVRQAARRVGVAQKHINYVTVDLFDLGELRRLWPVTMQSSILRRGYRHRHRRMMFRSSWRENDRIRTEGLANLGEAARRNGISRFVQESFALTYPIAATFGLISKPRSIAITACLLVNQGVDRPRCD